jgi:hypothetical protein
MSIRTHDSLGKPLPSFILNGSVAYQPMDKKEWKPKLVKP